MVGSLAGAKLLRDNEIEERSFEGMPKDLFKFIHLLIARPKLLIGTLISIFACAKDNAITSEQSINIPEDVPGDIQFDKNSHTLEEGRIYATAKLYEHALVLNDMISSEANRGIIYEEVDKLFDGDFNVLFSKVVERIGFETVAQSVNSVLGTSSKSRSVDPTTLNELLEAFNDIVGESYYPQVFIPFYDELKEHGQLGKEIPYFVPYPSDDGSAVLDGYRFDQENATKHRIDENFAHKNEVWVISLNEVVNNDGNLPDNGSSANKRAISTHVDFMICKSHKESWASGASEVAHRSLRTTVNGWSNNPWNASSWIVETDLTSDLGGTLIYQFSRNAVDNHWDKYPNVLLPTETTWNVDNYTQHAIVVPYVIFESDNWPTGTRTNVEFLPEGHDVSGVTGDVDRYMTYRSADPDYDRGIYYGNNSTSIGAAHYIVGADVNQSDIEYTIN